MNKYSLGTVCNRKGDKLVYNGIMGKHWQKTLNLLSLLPFTGTNDKFQMFQHLKFEEYHMSLWHRTQNTFYRDQKTYQWQFLYLMYCYKQSWKLILPETISCFTVIPCNVVHHYPLQVRPKCLLGGKDTLQPYYTLLVLFL